MSKQQFEKGQRVAVNGRPATYEHGHELAKGGILHEFWYDGDKGTSISHDGDVVVAIALVEGEQ